MPDQVTRTEFEELLEAYLSAVRLGVLDEMFDRRRALLDAFDARQLQDGEFRLEGNLFGAVLAARGRMNPRQYRDPEQIAGFFGELVMKMMAGIEGVLEEWKKRSDGAREN